jgi:hypothetical protein
VWWNGSYHIRINAGGCTSSILWNLHERMFWGPGYKQNFVKRAKINDTEKVDTRGLLWGGGGGMMAEKLEEI